MDFGLAREQMTADAPSLAGQLALDAGARAAALADTFGAGVDPDATAKLGRRRRRATRRRARRAATCGSS